MATPARSSQASDYEGTYWDHLKTLNEMQTGIRNFFEPAFAFRDSQTNSDRANSILQAKTYIAGHFSDPNLSLNEVAAQVRLQP